MASVTATESAAREFRALPPVSCATTASNCSCSFACTDKTGNCARSRERGGHQIKRFEALQQPCRDRQQACACTQVALMEKLTLQIFQHANLGCSAPEPRPLAPFPGGGPWHPPCSGRGCSGRRRRRQEGRGAGGAQHASQQGAPECHARSSVSCGGHHTEWRHMTTYDDILNSVVPSCLALVRSTLAWLASRRCAQAVIVGETGSTQTAAAVLAHGSRAPLTSRLWGASLRSMASRLRASNKPDTHTRSYPTLARTCDWWGWRGNARWSCSSLPAGCGGSCSACCCAGSQSRGTLAWRASPACAIALSGGRMPRKM